MATAGRRSYGHSTMAGDRFGGPSAVYGVLVSYRLVVAIMDFDVSPGQSHISETLSDTPQFLQVTKL